LLLFPSTVNRWYSCCTLEGNLLEIVPNELLREERRRNLQVGGRGGEVSNEMRIELEKHSDLTSCFSGELETTAMR